MADPTTNGNGLRWFEKEAGRLIISQGIFAVLFVSLLAYVLWNNAKREEALISTLQSLVPMVQETKRVCDDSQRLLSDIREDIRAMVRSNTSRE